MNGRDRAWQLPYAPKMWGTVAMDWEAWFVAMAKLTLHLDMNYNSKQYLALPDEDAISQGVFIADGRLSMHSPDDVWDVGVWGRNIADEFYLTNAVDVPGGFDYRHVGPPRMYGFDAHHF